MVTFQDRIWEVFEQEKDKEHKCTREKFAKNAVFQRARWMDM